MSLRKLSSALAVFALASLSVVSLSIPAQAATAAATITPSGADSVNGGAGTVAGMTVTSSASTTAAVRSLRVTAVYGVSSTGFNVPQACSGSGKTFTDCGITSVSVGGTSFTASSGLSVDGIRAVNQVPTMTINLGTDLTGVVTIVFAAGAWTAPDFNGTYPLSIEAVRSNTLVADTFSANLTVVNARQTVLLFRNTSSSDNTFTSQQSATPTALTANPYTNAGYYFAGWATTRTGTVAYTDGQTYPFASPTTANIGGAPAMLYAIWTTTPPSPSGGGGTGGNSGSGSASESLATTGAETTIPFGAAATLLLLGAALIVRRRSAA